jgi:hypothetical protein
MPIGGKLILALAVGMGLAAMWAQQVIAQGGLTLSPATATLTLDKGTKEQQATFRLVNHYNAPLTLGFAFTQAANALPDAADPKTYLAVKRSKLTLAAGQTATQTIIFKDSAALQPGSHAVDLVITQSSGAQTGVGVLPGIRMPLTVVKADGAISDIAMSGFGALRFAYDLPGSLSATLHNSGNMVAIPRGFITVTGPGGSVVSQGVLNTASLAVTPGKDIALTTPLTKLKNALWPGMYHATLSYGLGGGRQAKTTSFSFVYVAWWHVVALAAAVAAGYVAAKQLVHLLALRAKAHPAPKRALLIGRDIT